MWAGRQCYVTEHPSGVDGITKRRSGGEGERLGVFLLAGVGGLGAVGGVTMSHRPSTRWWWAV